MVNRPECPQDENIVRALRSADYDPNHQRYSSDVFKGPYTSVGRLKILTLPELFEIFRRDLDREEPYVVCAAGEINVGELQRIGKEYLGKPTTITVEQAPIKGDDIPPDKVNPAHAEIVQRLSRGLCLKIVGHLEIHPHSGGN